MGLLSNGTPLEWDKSKKFIKYIKEHGIMQFINIIKSLEKQEELEKKTKTKRT